MKTKHNKKRNTAFLYEALIVELTKRILQEDEKGKILTSSIIKEHFRVGTQLRRQLDLYNELLEGGELEERQCERLIIEAKLTNGKLDDDRIFKEQSALIKRINSELTREVFANFVPNYKDLATISQIFNDELPIKHRILLERGLIEKLAKVKIEEDGLVPIDNLVYKTFVERFNKQYDNKLIAEQKALLSHYISSFTDNSVQLKLFLEKEIGRLKGMLTESIHTSEIGNDEHMMTNTKLVIEKLNNLRNQEIDEPLIEAVLKIQELVKEIES
jgi:hypothetical protein